MPTRILYWNIRDFARNKISHPSVKKRKLGSSLNEAQAAEDRCMHILWLVGQVAPQIIVVVETETAFSERGTLALGQGGRGARLLLNGIREQTNNVAWRLVPPLQTGPNEAVSVFYDSTNRYFTGPFIWPGGWGTAQPGGVPGPYPDKHRAGLPNRTIPAAAQYNGTVSERHVAARTEFVEAAHTGNPGSAIDYDNHRAPYMTTFTETNNANVVIRNLSLFSIHAPASFAARQYLRDLADNAQIVDGMANNEVRVIVGDFNWNLLINTLTPSQSYQQLVNRGYTLVLSPPAVPPNPSLGYRGYFATHLARTRDAVFWSTNGNPSYYPAYGYRSGTDYAIDNMFVRYGAGLNPPGNNNFTIMNPVVGTPYNFVPVPPGNAPIGSIALAQEMDTPPVIANPAQAYSPGLMRSFRSWEKYGHIYSVSDHLSLAIDV